MTTIPGPNRWKCAGCSNWYPFPCPHPSADPRPWLCSYCLRSEVDAVAERILGLVWQA